jgi:hypothetical protein
MSALWLQISFCVLEDPATDKGEDRQSELSPACPFPEFADHSNICGVRQALVTKFAYQLLA